MQNAHWKITQPCHEPIEKMDVTPNGHYCHSCKKEVLNLDGVKPQDIGYKPGDEICGRMTTTLITPAVGLRPAGKWSSFLLKYFGAAALFLIPLKKGKAQNQVQESKPDAVPEKKFLTKPKRLIGTLRGPDGKPMRTGLVLTDSTGKKIADTTSIANGKYLLEVDTSKITGDSLTLTAKDTGIVWTVDTASVVLYPKDSIYILRIESIDLMGVIYNPPTSIITVTTTYGWTSGITPVTGERKQVDEGGIKALMGENGGEEINPEEDGLMPSEKKMGAEALPLKQDPEDKPEGREDTKAVILPVSNSIQRNNKKSNKK